MDALLCPAHVSAIIGAAAYAPVARKHGVPCVIAGFEPLDILNGIHGALRQLREGRAEVENQYARVVRAHGNPSALALIEKYLEPCDSLWRGMGMMPQCGYRLKKEFSTFDAAVRFGVDVGAGVENPACRCGDILRGRARPPECPLFGKACTPAGALGPCMVSGEGACAAWLRHMGA